jgi:hypothetical protein
MLRPIAKINSSFHRNAALLDELLLQLGAGERPD